MKTIQSTVYGGFGLVFSSEIELPELMKIDVDQTSIDIKIEIMDLKDSWNNFKVSNRFCLVEDQVVWIYIPDTAIFCIKNGNNIVVSPLKLGEEDRLRLYILGSCMGALLLQRGILPLHGSAISINNKAYGIVGDSGAGKSTLAAALLSKGYSLLSDDIIPISLLDNKPMVTPAYPQQKLWKESLDVFSVDTNQFSSIFDRETKFIVPVSSHFHSEPLELGGIFELVKGKEDSVALRQIHKLEQIKKLYDHTFRQFLVERLNIQEWHFRLTASVASVTSMYQLQRPTNRLTINDLTELILNTIDKE
ncbi:aldolase [Robertmurraya sp. P23]|uniref:aldolase n=1 Tax=Robertmurraya sp. P23 TaxID=3436931 RepID=UPI003D9610AB